MSRDLSTRDTEPVSWIGGKRGLDEESEMVRQAIVERHVVNVGALIADIAEHLFARDNACVGSVGDLGFFRSWYVIPARRLVERLEGTALQVGAPPSARQAGRR
jgi:hypothetical protein